ncbi:ParA family protein [Deinococcus sonorensis]|uniref:AAA family ATPase n=2 Tax=Deinococcus sonorensis TaxID=309891 RepID=A0AAU7UDN9_9DEIO
MSRVISFINLKGGVAKTTTLVQVAETLAFMRGQRVLVLDLDPQTNATIALMGEDAWERVDEAQQTVAQLFLDQIHGTRTFELPRAIVRGVSNLNRITIPAELQLRPELLYPRIDLLPSSIRLIEAQDRMADIPQRSHYTLSPMEVIRRHVAPVFGQYDYVLIDCPPNLGYITQNGLEVSDDYLIPTIPDRLSTYGIPQIVRSIADIQRARDLRIQLLGVAVTKYDSRSRTHKAGLDLLPALIRRACQDAGVPRAPLFETIMPQANATAEAMDSQHSPGNFRDKYSRSQSGGRALYEYPVALTAELLEEIERQTAQLMGAGAAPVSR